MTDIKFLGDGSAVLVVGEAPPRSTSVDGGRTVTDVPQSFVARLAIEEVENDALLDERPEFDPGTATWIQKGQEPQTAPAGTPSGATDAPAVPARGEAQNADELQAEIDRLTAEKAALEANHQTEVPPAGEPPVV